MEILNFQTVNVSVANIVCIQDRYPLTISRAVRDPPARRIKLLLGGGGERNTLLLASRREYLGPKHLDENEDRILETKTHDRR